jgi:methylmalonyl-CoA epimerase
MDSSGNVLVPGKFVEIPYFLIEKGMGRMKAPNKIAHIGIAVKSIAEVLPFYTEQLGLTLLGEEEVPSEQVKVAFLEIGESRIELLEPLTSQSPIASFLEKRGEGIHHIALDVDDVHERLLRLKENGVPLINETPKEGAHNAQIGFLHPKAAKGVLYELCQYPRDHHETNQ